MRLIPLGYRVTVTSGLQFVLGNAIDKNKFDRKITVSLSERVFVISSSVKKKCPIMIESEDKSEVMLFLYEKMSVPCTPCL